MFEPSTRDVYGLYGYGSIPISTILVGWTSIYQLFWCSPGVQGLTHCHIWLYIKVTYFGVTKLLPLASKVHPRRLARATPRLKASSRRMGRCTKAHKSLPEITELLRIFSGKRREYWCEGGELDDYFYSYGMLWIGSVIYNQQLTAAKRRE